jgi:hypothetical protein
MQAGRIYALLSLSFVLHLVTFWCDTVVPKSVTLVDKYNSNPVTMTQRDLADMLRLTYQAGLTEADTYTLYVVKQSPMGVAYVKQSNPVGPHGPYEKHLTSLQQRGLIKEDNGVWILTETGRRATSVPQ